MTIKYLYSKFFKKIVRGKSILHSTIHKTAVVNSGCSVVNSSVGKCSYLGYDAEIVNCKIGAYCSIAGNVHIGGAEHPTDWVSTSPVFQKVKHSGPTLRYAEHELPSLKQTIVGNDVWIGFGAIVKQGVIIGDGAIVGSGAVVTKDVAPYSIVGGCPAKLIRYRFDEKTIAELNAIQWWNMSDEELSQLGKYATNVKEFIRIARSLK